MEMTWMETFRLLGLDLLAFVLIALVGLDVVEHAVHSAWETARSRRSRVASPVDRPLPRVGGIKHV
jgi:hypothetical protein